MEYQIRIKNAGGNLAASAYPPLSILTSYSISGRSPPLLPPDDGGRVVPVLVFPPLPAPRLSEMTTR